MGLQEASINNPSNNELNINNKSNAKLLDWKLDFINPVYRDAYEREYNAAEVPLAKAAIATGATSIVVALIGYFIESNEHFKIKQYTNVFTYSLWCLLWFPFYYIDIVKRHSATLTCFVLNAIPLIVNTGNILSESTYALESVLFNFSLFVIMAPIVLRLRVKQVLLLAIVDLIYFSVSFSLTMKDVSIASKIGMLLPTIFNIILGAYCGVFFERNRKYDFFRRQRDGAEAAKLEWIVARDASLLRNIFPKYMSDELEARMIDQPAPPIPFSPSASILRVVSNTAMKLQQLATLRNGEEGASHESLLSLSKERESEERELNQISVTVSTSRSRAGSMVNNSAARFQGLSVAIPRGSPQKSSFLTPSSNSNSSPCFNNNVVVSSRIGSPPVVTSPCMTPDFNSSSIVTAPYETMVDRLAIPSQGTPLNSPNFLPELQSFLSGTDSDSPICLSHSYPNVTVIFADIVGFTSLSSTISPQSLVELLNTLFSQFDDIVDFHCLEKIRTVGDAYLCVANMTKELDGAALAAVRAAKGMISEVHRLNITMNVNLSLRVGIASGPLIAGVTGKTKWNYDIYGKPLSDASLMETLAPPNCIAISKSVYDECKNDPEFYFEHANNKEHEYYLMRRLLDPLLDIIPSRLQKPKTTDNLAFLAQPVLDPIHKEILRESISAILEDDSFSFGSLSPLSLNPASSTSSVPINSSGLYDDLQLDVVKRFGFSREDLELEKKKLQSKLFIFKLKFKRPEFEAEFAQKSLQTTKNYTTILVLLFSLSIVITFISDVMTGDNFSFREVVVTAVVPFILSLYALVYSRYFDNQKSDYLAAGAALIYVLAVDFIYFLFSSGRHLTLIVVTVNSITSFIRVPIHLMLITQFIYVVTSLGILISNPLLRGYHTSAAAVLFFFLATSYFTQTSIQKSFRQQFLVTKKIQVDMYHQRVSQRRAKLLIQNILPLDIIPRLQNPHNNKIAVVDLFEQATIIFINITNLVELTENLDPSSAFQIYNELFTQLDEISKTFKIEKIKTINNVYMAACGLPNQIPNHADTAVYFAIECYRAISRYTFPQVDKRFKVRIGAATGPVVAGIIGKKKYAYDCWSDTTNTASRMESNGWNGYLQVTPYTFETLKQKSHFEKREQLDIKGKGTMDTYVFALKKFVPTLKGT